MEYNDIKINKRLNYIYTNFKNNQNNDDSFNKTELIKDKNIDYNYEKNKMRF
jgi:hypothetical protein